MKESEFVLGAAWREASQHATQPVPLIGGKELVERAADNFFAGRRDHFRRANDFVEINFCAGNESAQVGGRGGFVFGRRCVGLGFALVQIGQIRPRGLHLAENVRR